MVDENHIPASHDAVSLWQQKKKRLWIDSYHILVSKVIYEKINLKDLKNGGIKKEKLRC